MVQSWTLIDATPVPGGTETLRLMQRGSEFAINLGRELLMGSRMRQSEEVLARLGCAALAGRAGPPRVLIGGLGMGFTLRAALDALDARASVEVAELVPAVVDWVRGPLAPLSNHALDDPRVEVTLADVGDVIRPARQRYDAILLDVDNGPEGLTRDGNGALYDAAGLRRSFEALRPGGALGVWSAHPEQAFADRLSRLGFAVREHVVRAHGRKGARHRVWIATRPAGRAPGS